MLRNMYWKIVTEVTENKTIAQFQVGYMYFTNMKLHNIFSEQAGKSTGTAFSGETWRGIKTC